VPILKKSPLLSAYITEKHFGEWNPNYINMYPESVAQANIRKFHVQQNITKCDFAVSQIV